MPERKPARTFEDLVVWQKAHAFVLEVYRVSGGFPSNERYGLTSQLRRAAVSIAANVAEGFKKRSRTDKARFVNMAQGSLEEVRYYLILMHDLSYAMKDELVMRLEEVSRLLNAYGRALSAPRPPTNSH